jgi:acetyltransferase-like isoleucine patch superfamily enzyme
VVTRNVEPYTVVGGNPARRICDRFKTEEERHLHELATAARRKVAEGKKKR